MKTSLVISVVGVGGRVRKDYMQLPPIQDAGAKECVCVCGCGCGCL